MRQMSNEIIEQNSGFMQVNSLEQALKVSEYIANSNFCPISLKGKPGDVLIALQMGQELGLKPMQAIQNIAVINGRPSIWGDAMLAVCRQSKDFEYIKETYDEATKTAFCTVKRRNEPEFIQNFSQAKAKAANLWGKQGPWTQYPERMLQMRARGFALRDSFPDLLRGMISDDEAQDYRVEVDYSHHNGVVYDQELEMERVISVDEIEDLRAKMHAADRDEEAVCKYLNIKCLADMTILAHKEINRILDRAIEKKNKIALPVNEIFKEPVEADNWSDNEK
jgi:hypothetical protein